VLSPRRCGCEKIGTGTSPPSNNSKQNSHLLGASPIFPQPQSVERSEIVAQFSVEEPSPFDLSRPTNRVVLIRITDVNVFFR
jgi:hypothetical protein